jgi:competence protein ComGC
MNTDRGQRIRVHPCSSVVKNLNSLRRVSSKVNSDDTDERPVFLCHDGMRINCRYLRKAGLTLLEVILVIATITLWIGLLLPALLRATARSSRIGCVNNLKQVGLAARVFANDNEDEFPWRISTNSGGSREYQSVPNSAFRHFQVMSNELSTPKIIICPQDRERSPATNWIFNFDNRNVSYFIGLDSNQTNVNSIVSGDRKLTASRPAINGFLELTANDTVQWTREFHANNGNLLFGDGGVQGTTSKSLRAAFSSMATNRLVIP